MNLHRTSRIIAMALLPTIALSVTVPAASSAQAAPMVGAVGGLNKSDANMVEVRWRDHRGDRGWRHQGWGRGSHGYGWAPAVGGFVAGAAIGSAIANSRAQAESNSYCSQRFKSYDPSSGTYLGYDGMRHPCP